MAQEAPSISTPDGTFSGYLALPDGGSGPGLVVIQEIFGVNQVMRDFCDFFAAEGFVAFCPDLFWRIEPGIDITDQTEEEWAQAFDLFGKFDRSKGVEDISASLEMLKTHKAVSGKVGTVGYCLGGYMAYVSATRTDTDASVGYYGVSIQDSLDESGSIKNPLMLHIAEKDEFVSSEDQEKIKQGLDSNKLVTIHSYAEQDHAFARPGGAHYDKVAADLANERTISFLHQHLKT